MAEVTDSYANPEDYRAYRDDADNTHDNELKVHLAMSSRFIERKTGQFFTKDSAVVNRLYTGNGTRCLAVDNIADSSGVVIKIDTDLDGVFSDEDAWASTDYQLRPLNRDKGPELRPWYEIYIPAWSTKTSFPGGYPVQVTAKFGWPSVPAAIKSACIEICAIWRGQSTRATGNMQEIEQVVSMSPYAASLVKQLQNAYRVPVLG